MQLSIVIVNWNSRELLAQALDALSCDGGLPEHEVIVIDSGSFDGCAQMMARRHPGARFLQSACNLGFARANNVAAEHCRGDLLLFLNPDTEAAVGAVGHLCRTLVASPQAAIAGPRLLNSDGSLQDTCVRAFPSLLNQALDARFLRDRFPRSRLWGKRCLLDDAGRPARVDAVSGACLLIRREVFEAVRGFSDDYFMYAEDMDLCLKVARAGFDCIHVPGATVVHHGGCSSERSSVSGFAAVMAVESQWRYFRKTRSAAYAAVYRATLGVVSVVRLAGLLAAWPCLALGHGGRAPAGTWAFGKWLSRLRWALGGENWCRRLSHGGPPRRVGNAGVHPLGPA